MSRLPVVRRSRTILIGAALIALLALPGAALADTTTTPTIYPAESRGATIEVSGGTILGRVVVSTKVAFTCQPFRSFDWQTGQEVETTEGSLEFGAVTILQASGRTINYGEAEFFGGPVVCDGTTVNRRDVAVGAGVAPWKSGSAVAGARVHVASADFNSSDYASSGAIVIRLSR